MIEWNIEKLLPESEEIIYKCFVENDEKDIKTNVYLTNKRIIWITGDSIDSRRLKFISKFGIFIGFEDNNQYNDIGNGEYGVYFGDNSSYETVWFYDEESLNDFYLELSRRVLEN